MKQILFILFASLLLIGETRAQLRIRPLDQLIIKGSDTWNLIKEQIKKAKNQIQILPKNNIAADSALYEAQITTRSPMGAIVYETGGILVDNGWIRILGSGCDQFSRSLMSWNKGKSFINFGEQPAFLLIADDIIGGFYAVNGGGIDSAGIGKVFYFAPDNLKWTNLELSYTDFFGFCLSGSLDKFYKGFRWSGWRKEISKVNGDSGFTFYPFLWSKEGQDNINKNTRKVVPIEELWEFNVKKKGEVF